MTPQVSSILVVIGRQTDAKTRNRRWDRSAIQTPFKTKRGFWGFHCTGPQARQPGQTRRDMKRKNSTTIPRTIKPTIFLNTFLTIIILGSFYPLVQFIREIPSNSPPKTVSSVDLKARVPVHLSRREGCTQRRRRRSQQTET